MSASEHTVLVAVVEHYEAIGEPAGTGAVADLTDGDDAAVAACLDALADSEFLVETPSGYRPTVTAREFLALDVDLTDVVAVEVVEE